MTTTKAAGKPLQITTPDDREIRITRSFDAPRQLVWDAYTRPELLKRWLGAMPGWSWAVCEMDVRKGGRYRWVWRGPEGAELGAAAPPRTPSGAPHSPLDIPAPPPTASHAPEAAVPPARAPRP